MARAGFTSRAFYGLRGGAGARSLAEVADGPLCFRGGGLFAWGECASEGRCC